MGESHTSTVLNYVILPNDGYWNDLVETHEKIVICKVHVDNPRQDCSRQSG